MDQEYKQQLTEESEAEHERNQRLLTESFEEQISVLEAALGDTEEGSDDHKTVSGQIESVRNQYDEQMGIYDDNHQKLVDDFADLQPLRMLTESKYRELKDSYGDVFEAGMGAEAIQEILRHIDLNNLKEELALEMKSTSGQKRKKAIKRLIY